MDKSKVIEEFIQRLRIMSGTGNGIGETTVAKIQEFAEKEGFIKPKFKSTVHAEVGNNR